jgi:hypothetical protein
MDKQVKNITRQELITLLSKVNKPTFTNVVMETKVRMDKTNNPYYDKVVKRSKCNYSLGIDYQKRVNNNYTKEGIESTFESEKPSGKHHVGNSKCLLIDDKTESVHYVMLERFDEIQPQNEFIFEGNQIDKQIFQDYLVKVSESQKQQQDRKVMVLTPKIENIKEISLEGTKYIITE